MKAVGRVLAAVLVASVALPASAAGPCTVITDPAGDVVTGRGIAVPDPHLDLTAVTLATSGDVLELRVKATKLLEHRRGEWLVFFSVGRTRYVVTAGLGAWVNVGDYAGPVGFRAGPEDGRRVAVRGGFDYAASEVRVHVPLRLLRATRGTGLTGFHAAARETFAHVVPEGSPVGFESVLADPAESRGRYVVGRTC